MSWDRAMQQARRMPFSKDKRESVRLWAFYCRQALTGRRTSRSIASGQQGQIPTLGGHL